MADHAELIANFVAVSGATPEQAQFYLEANNWDINQPLRGTTGRQEQLQEDYVDEDDDEDLNDVLAQPAPKSASKK
ncbi:MAG: hypothetical protein BYD32DRAFT_464041 [Podila humilis]|nr:MAG: hypothetical protein BYD32DRAFT_464041 [Podila humilis]